MPIGSYYALPSVWTEGRNSFIPHQRSGMLHHRLDGQWDEAGCLEDPHSRPRFPVCRHFAILPHSRLFHPWSLPPLLWTIFAILLLPSCCHCHPCNFATLVFPFAGRCSVAQPYTGINSLQRMVLVVLLNPRRWTNSLPCTAWPDLKPPLGREASGVQVWTGVQGSPFGISSGATAGQGNAV